MQYPQTLQGAKTIARNMDQSSWKQDPQKVQSTPAGTSEVEMSFSARNRLRFWKRFLNGSRNTIWIPGKAA